MTALTTRVGEYGLSKLHRSACPTGWRATIVFTLLFLLLASSTAAPSTEPKHVLILMQEDLSWPVFHAIDENAQATLRSGLPGGIVILGEHMDRIEFPDPHVQAQQQAWIHQKYANRKLDLVIAVGDVPTDMFPNVPLLYLGTRPQMAPRVSPARSNNSAAIWVGLDVRKTMEAALRLHPQAQQFVVVAGSSTSDAALLALVRDQLATYSDHPRVSYLTNLSLPELSERVATLGPESIILYVTFSRDSVGRALISAEVIPKIAAVSGAPVYVFLDTHIGSGAVGGYVTRFDEMGKLAGEMGLRMLAGERPPDAVAPTEYLFDARQLRHWKTPESALPPGSVVLYRQPNIWETYRYYIVGAILLSLLETLLILALLWQRANRRKFEGSLLERMSFQKLLSDLSATFINLPEEQVTPTMEQSLPRIADFLDLQRITLHEVSLERTVLTPTICWNSEGPQLDPAAINADRASWWARSLLQGEIVLVPDLEVLPEEATAERQYLQKLGALSVAAIPLSAGDEFFGSISFISTKRRVLWTAPVVEQLKLLAEIFSNALMRKRAQSAFSRHAAIVESSDDAIISKNLDGIILSWNKSAQRLFGYSEDEAVGQPTTMLIPPELRHEEHDILRRSMAGERIEHYETVRVTKTGETLNVSLTISPLKDSTGKALGFFKIARDITERKRVEQTLRESEERFRLVANSAPSLIWMAGTDKLCIFFNQGWLNFTGRSMKEELGDGWVSGVHPEDVRRCHQFYSDSFDARTEFEMEYRLRRADGEYRWIVDHGVPRFESDGTFCGYIGSCVDITDRKLSEEALHSLSGRLINAQEEERARIARELHDDFSQRLALLGIGLGQLWKKLPESDFQERSKVLGMLKDTKEMSSDLHTLSHQLHSSKLEHVGLVAALNGLCNEISEKYHIPVQFTDFGIPFTIPKEVALCLFRVAQEALGNVAKHSGAKSAQVELSAMEDGVKLRISDQGRGFDPGLKSSGAGIGLIGMSERLRLIGGRLSVNSQPGRGTDIIADAPLAVTVKEAQLKAQSSGA